MADIMLKKKKFSRAKILTGRNCELFLDGQKIRGATRFDFFVDAKGMAKATIELVVHSLNSTNRFKRR